MRLDLCLLRSTGPKYLSCVIELNSCDFYIKKSQLFNGTGHLHGWSCVEELAKNYQDL